MATKKKDKKLLINVKGLGENELDKKLDRTLDALFGPDEDAPEVDDKPEMQKVPAKGKK